MLRSIAGSAALIAVLATGAQAQAPVNVQFQVAGCSGVNTFNTACNLGSSIGSFNGLTGQFVGGSTFQIWCVDEGDDIVPFIPTGFYDAWATSLAGSDFSHVYTPGGAPTNYAEAASLTQFMSGTDDFIDPSNPATAHGTPLWGGNPQIQFAIWQLMGFDPQSATSSYNLADVDHWISLADASSVDLSNWVVISDDLGPGHGEQEFLANVSEPVVPEPGTLGMMAMGLTGLAGAGMRRRRRK
ncbi:MAG TPA: PEP-CTERM sorting domain-containing protein [Gemmatimonadales bacterium]